jgi:hypothetical protein
MAIDAEIPDLAFLREFLQSRRDLLETLDYLKEADKQHT